MQNALKIGGPWAIVLLILAGAMVAAAGPASAGDRVPPAMPMGAQATPPIGFIAMCSRQPASCEDRPAGGPVPKTRSTVAASPEAGPYGRYFWQVALSPDAPAARLSSRFQRPAPARRPASGFGRTDWSIPAAPTVAFAGSAGRPGSASTTSSPSWMLESTRASWRQLNRVNRQVNRAIRERSDLASTGLADQWSLPIIDGRLEGDCEDFALEKRRLLIEGGVDPRALSIALVRTRSGESHAVLLVSTDTGEFVLDNLSPWITLWSRLDYRWVQRQVPGQPTRWVTVPVQA